MYEFLFGHPDYVMGFLGAIVGGIGSLLGGAGKVVGNILGTAAGSTGASLAGDRYMLEKKHQFSKREAEKDRAFQSAERVAAHEYGTKERVAQQAFSAQQAAKMMGFQERMSSTQTQRASADMKKAGLNRILALGSPAVAPSGAMATASQPSSHKGSGSRASASSGGEGANAIRNAIGLMSAKQMIELQKAQTYKTRQEGRAASATADKIETQAIPYSIFQDLLGRSGGAAREIGDFGKGLWNKYVESVNESRGKRGLGDDPNITTIQIRRGKGTNDRKKNWED